MQYKQLVHYLCRDENNFLKYPFEYPDYYSSPGSFYIIGQKEDEYKNYYNIVALDGEKIVHLEISKSYIKI